MPCKRHRCSDNAKKLKWLEATRRKSVSGSNARRSGQIGAVHAPNRGLPPPLSRRPYAPVARGIRDRGSLTFNYSSSHFGFE